ncbi:hypothetical protein GJ697_21590 [Pseudoduganella sp. FT25W]|jgi:predicted nucleic acid-binding protein|uniref:PIN domain-containing protein n=1 Tax=Duganella alba TaxID=2666081 RepID=A0A6L5QKU5_9BURK|nr:PIN domain-containing protein [Duganella alba]MRX10433.1 hypothetical protein [Duganella alba]MRX17954.1 hypothetical protein [Duganella alba]
MLKAMHGHKVYVDTNVFIYFLEQNADFFAAVEPIIQAIDCKELQGFTGEITIAETLVGPYRNGNPLLIANALGFLAAAAFSQFFPTTNSFLIVPRNYALHTR